MSAAKDTREHDVNVQLAIALGHTLGTPGLELLMYDLARTLREQLTRAGLRLVDTPERAELDRRVLDPDEWPDGPIEYTLEPAVAFARPLELEEAWPLLQGWPS